MTKKSTALGFGMLLFLAATMVAQGVRAADDSGGNKSENTRTLTGCLRSGNESNLFKLDSQDGGTWDVRSENVKLASQVGHTVTLTGPVVAANNKKENQNRMAVTKLAVVSNGCQSDIPMQQ